MSSAYAQYLVHHIPMDVWVAAQARAQQEQWPMHGLVVQLLTDYARGAVSPTTRATAEGATLIARTDPHVPLRTAVIMFRSDRKEHRLPCAAASDVGGVSLRKSRYQLQRVML